MKLINKTITIKITQCPKCKYEWQPRQNQPKACPKCKTRLDKKTKIKLPKLPPIQPLPTLKINLA